MTANSDGITRRRFITTAATGIAAAGLLGRVEAAGATLAAPSSRVVAVSSTEVFSGSDIDGAVVSRMLDSGAQALTPEGGLWESLFSADDVVGIKLNCIARTVKPNKALIDAVVECLKRAGVKENNIIVWDRFEDQLARRARLTLNAGSEGVRVYGSERGGDSVSGYDKDVYYESDQDTAEYRGETGTRSLVTKIVTTDCTKIINMPVLKDHNQAGVTACLKNLAFGSVNNTARFHKAPMYCSPAVPEIFALKPIAEKTVLHILDGLKVCYNGGPDASNPAFITNHSTIYLSRDPVACDTVALGVVEQMRADAGLPDLFTTSGQPVHVAKAAEMGLGQGDRGKIDLVKLAV